MMACIQFEGADFIANFNGSDPLVTAPTEFLKKELESAHDNDFNAHPFEAVV